MSIMMPDATTTPLIELRDYQEHIVRLAEKSFLDKHANRELVVLPCGGGKTIIFSAFVNRLLTLHGQCAIIMAHMDDLLTQTAEKYRYIDPSAQIGKIGNGEHVYTTKITVASVQTGSKPECIEQLKLIHGTGKNLVIVVDEAHLSAAEGYQRFLNAFPDAFILLVTATPYRLDGVPIIDKDPLFTKPIREMIEEGYLCSFRIIAINTGLDLSGVSKSRGDFNERELAIAVDTPERNKHIVDKYIELTPGKRAIVFAVNIKHAENLAAAFVHAGQPALAIHSKLSSSRKEAQKFRQDVYKKFDSGEVKILVSVMMLSIGFDSPRAEVAIMSRPTLSQALYVQQIGRVLRLAPGKTGAILLDITDNSFKMRVQPQNFKTAFKDQLDESPCEDEDGKPDESDLDPEAEEDFLEYLNRVGNMRRAKKHKKHKEIIRKIKKRSEDKELDPFGLPEWVEKPEHGAFVLTMPANGPRIAIWPTKSLPGSYDIYARFPRDNFAQAQKWAGGLPLDMAVQIAEKKAKLMQQDAKHVQFADQSASWRRKPVSDPQREHLQKGIDRGLIVLPEGQTIDDIKTSGQASDLLNPYFEALDVRREKRKKAIEIARDKKRPLVQLSPRILDSKTKGA